MISQIHIDQSNEWNVKKCRIDEVNDFQLIGNGEIAPDEVQRQHPENQVLKPIDS